MANQPKLIAETCPRCKGEDMTVEYRDIPGTVGRRVGDDGSVWSRWTRCHPTLSDTWRELKGHVSDKGYRIVQWRVNGVNHSFKVHHLVLLAFVGPCPEGLEACHEDDDGLNNRLSNLRWDTHVANGDDAKKNGRTYVGQDHPASKLSDEDVATIRRRIAAGESTASVSRHYRIHSSHASRIANRKTRCGFRR